MSKKEQKISIGGLMSPYHRRMQDLLETTPSEGHPKFLPLLPVPRDRDMRLSFSQERLWILDRLGLGSIAYAVPLTYSLKGVINTLALEKSINEIVRRHEILRTTFGEKNGNPIQIIHKPKDHTLDLIDLSDLTEAEREDAVRRISGEAKRPFDLSKGPLLRISLLRLSDEDHILLLTIHHIIFDGWSTGILLAELSVLYKAFSEGNPSPLPGLPIQYGDFAVWQRQWLQGEALESLLAYWKRKLDGAPPVLELPADRPRPPVQSHQGASQSKAIPKTISEGLKSLSRQEGVTLFMVLLAAFKTLLYRYTGQEDIVIGTPVANRKRVEIENLIGFFVNTLILRTDLSGNPTFRQLLGRVRENTLEAYDHQDLPFERLVEELQPERSLSHSPLVQVMFTFQNTMASNLTLPGLSANRLRPAWETAKFDLTLFIANGKEGLIETIEYNTDLFDGETISRMAGHFQNLLEGMVSDPDTRVSELPLLSEAERHRIVVDWNNTTAEYPRDKCIHQLFQQQAARTPGAEAVVFEQKKLTYGELNSQANQLARRLRAAGSGTGELVGICLERSIDMVIGILGILKAGGAYVPLDPSYPADRLNFMLEDAQIRLLLTEKRHRNIFPAYKGAIINLDDEQAAHSHGGIENPDVPVSADGLAYVIYTSGSTGKPKGVCVPHRAVNRLVTNTNYIALGPSDVVAHVSNCSFDAATFEIWGALLNGARLVGLGHAVILSPEDFAAALQTHRINTLFLTTALFNQMAHAVPDAFRTVRSLLFGGEAADPECVRRVVHAGPPERLIHVYGPTENTTFTSWYPVEDVPEKALTVPIGRPVSNTRIYLLDRHHHPVPVGATGELYAAGDGLAQGYLNRPELTAEKFVPGPFSTAGDARLYRTGDLARYRADGTIEFLGRIDNQIKIRGFRVEPEEIEAVLGQHDSVHSAAVAVHEDTPGDKRLGAYVVQKRDTTENDLRTFLKEKLPDYMVPSYFVFLDALPLTPNGKVDRGALPRLQGIRAELERTIEAPRDKVERRLTRLWENVLGTRPIGIKDNFFDLGGHSLLAARAAAKIKKQLGKDVPMDIIFRAPTVEQLAEVLRGQGSSMLWSVLLPLQTAGSRPPFFWVQGGAKAFLHRYLGPDQPLYALSHEGQDGKPAVHTTVEAIAAHYLGEIRTVQNDGPYLLGGYCFGGLVALEMAQQLKKQGQEVSLLVLVEPPPVCLRHLLIKVWRRHLHDLSPLGHREKLLHVLRKLKGAGEETVKNFKRRGRMLICKTYFRAGRPLPHSLRKFYIKETQRRATRAYVPQIYPGRILIFHTKALANIGRQGWNRLSSRGVEIHEVPDAKHSTIMHQPYVGSWGSILSTYLQGLYADDTTTSNKSR